MERFEGRSLRAGGRLAGQCAAVLLVLGAVLSPAVFHAAFTAPVDLSGTGASEPRVAVDTDGDALAVWKRSDGSFFRIEARARSAAGALGAVQTLSGAGRSAGSPRVAIDADGDALAVWRRRDGVGPCSNFGCFRIEARARSAAGSLGPVQTLSPPGQDVQQPQVAIDAGGDALAVWRRPDGTAQCGGLPGCFRIQTRARSAAGTLGTVQTLSAAGQDARNPQLVVAANGAALAVWERSDGTSSSCCSRIQARARSAAGTLAPVQTLSAPGQNASDPHLGIDADGDALAVWRRPDGTAQCGGLPGCFRIQARARSAAGTLGPVQTLSAAGVSAERPRVGVDADGDALAVWRRLDDGRILARARSAAGTLAPVQTLSPAGQNAVQPEVALAAGGGAVAVWGRRDGTGPCTSFGCVRIQARARSAAGALGTVQTLSAAGQDATAPRVALDGGGDALAVWQRGVIQAAAASGGTPFTFLFARRETVPVPHPGDAADDPTIWVDPQNPGRSAILGTDRDGGLAVYDLAGSQLQYRPDGKINNVDLRNGFPLGGGSVILVTAGNLTDNSIAIYRFNAATRRLFDVAARKITTGVETGGSCMYRSPTSGKFYAFVTSSSGQAEQWELFANGLGKVDARRVRTLTIGGQSEGCVADDRLARFYVSEEAVGVWSYGAEPSAGSSRVLVDSTGAGGHLVADVEGLAIAYGPGREGYLIASNQGNNTFAVYRRAAPHQWVTTFEIRAQGSVDGVEHTDGIDVTTASLGPEFPTGLFVVQDGHNEPQNQNFKLVPWRAPDGGGP